MEQIPYTGRAGVLKLRRIASQALNSGDVFTAAQLACKAANLEAENALNVAKQLNEVAAYLPNPTA